MEKERRTWLHVREVATILGRSPSAAREFIRKHRVKTFRTRGGHRRVDREDFWRAVDAVGGPDVP